MKIIKNMVRMLNNEESNISVFLIRNKYDNTAGLLVVEYTP